MLGSTLELCTLPDDLAGRLEGKSSLGRLGLLTHSTAGFIDPGFTGHITLELSNVANLPITLWPGMKIGQLCLLRLTSPAEHPYGSAKVGFEVSGPARPDAVALVPELHQIDVGGTAAWMKRLICSKPNTTRCHTNRTRFRSRRRGNLAAIAHLFGLGTPEVSSARVLEIGCSAGAI